jgi:hypothetical protein
MKNGITALAIALAINACGDDASRPGADAGARDGSSSDASADPDAGTLVVDAGGTTTDAGTDAPAADTWMTFAEGFFATYCTECHSGGTRDYRTIDDVMRDTATIRCGVSPDALSGCGSFPPPSQFPVGTGPRPSDEERQRLVAWIDAGLP